MMERAGAERVASAAESVGDPDKGVTVARAGSDGGDVVVES